MIICGIETYTHACAEVACGRWDLASSPSGWSMSGRDVRSCRGGTRLQLPVGPPMDGSKERSNCSARSSRQSHYSLLASPDPIASSSESSGVLVYHANSIQYSSSSSLEDYSNVATPPSAAATQCRVATSRSSERRSEGERATTRSEARQSARTTTRRPRQRSCLKRLGNTCRKRVPRGTCSVVVFLLNVIESFAFYGAIDSTLRLLFHDSSWRGTALTLLVQFTAGRVLYPVAGFLSDVYFGRYKTIQMGIWLFWAAFALLSLSLALSAGEVGSTKVNTSVVPVFAFVLICAGSAAIEVAIIPFGVDQLSQGASSHEQSSYFYWFYFGRQFGNTVGLLSFYGLSLLQIEQDRDCNKYAVSSIQSIAGLTGMTAALALVWWFKRDLFRDKQRENPLKEVLNVVCYAATAKDMPPVARRAFRYGEGRKRRMERAKLRYDGPYTSEEVEDVKTFCNILLVIFSLGLCFMTYTGVSIMLTWKIVDFTFTVSVTCRCTLC